MYAALELVAFSVLYNKKKTYECMYVNIRSECHKYSFCKLLILTIYMQFVVKLS